LLKKLLREKLIYADLNIRLFKINLTTTASIVFHKNNLAKAQYNLLILFESIDQGIYLKAAAINRAMLFRQKFCAQNFCLKISL